MNPDIIKGTYFKLERRCREKEFILLCSGALFDPETQSLICSDLHLGKSRHFRSKGIAVPRDIDNATIDKLKADIETTEAKDIYFLGDLFHSDYNSAVDDLSNLRAYFNSSNFHLIPGNHDILKPQIYQEIGLQVQAKSFKFDWIDFVHQPSTDIDEERFEIAGHIHPGVQLKANGRQYMRLPCFFWGRNYALLPAYGKFTGLSTITPDHDDEVFIIFDEKVVKLN